MNRQALGVSTVEDLSTIDEPELGGFELKKLSGKHKQVCALLAQGVDRATIASLVDFTPEYITMLAKEPLCKQYIMDMNEVAGMQLSAMFSKSVEVISDAMDNGNITEKLKGARLQLEATHRIGAADPNPAPTQTTDDRLERLASRLIDLLARNTPKEPIEGFAEVSQPEDSPQLPLF